MEMLLRFLENYCATAAVTKKYWALKKEELLNPTILALFWRFCNYVMLGGHILSISKTIFTKLIFHLSLSDKLSDVFFAGILYTFNVYISLH